MAFALSDFAQQELEAFFRRREERGKSYCAACLVERLARRGSRRVEPAAWTTVVANAFERPNPLQVKPRGPCEACQQLRPSIGAPHSV
jgi:hypothetical protein